MRLQKNKNYKSWTDNRATLSTYFKYPEAVRCRSHTTDIIEGFNRQLRKVTKSKMIVPTDGRLLKMLYLAMIVITKKNGQATVRIGDRYISNYTYILKSAWQEETCKVT